MSLGQKEAFLQEAMDIVPDAVIDTMTITGTPQHCASRIKDYEGIADEIIVSRLAQSDEPSGTGAFEELFDLVDKAGTSNQNA